MSVEIPTNTPEKKEAVDDNAIKFKLDNIDIDPEFLSEHSATSFLLTSDWLETDEANESKLAHKQYADGKIKILLIRKVTKDGKRTAVKQELTPEEYQELLPQSKLRVRKMRYEFDYTQADGATFAMKYDDYIDTRKDKRLRILEVDATTDAERELFNPTEFPYPLTRSTEDMNGPKIAQSIYT